MPEPTLFDERQVRRGDSHVFVQDAPQDAPAEPESSADMIAHDHYAPQDAAPDRMRSEPLRKESLAHRARREAFERLQKDGRRDNLRARYARLLYKAYAGGVQVKGKTVRALTDKEAAHLLGCQFTTINGRRGELMGGDDSLPEYQACPAVEEHQARRSLVMDSGQNVTAFRIRPDLFTENA